MSKKPCFFISHSSKDSEDAAEIASKLKKDTNAVWIAPDSLRPGDNFHDKINDGLKSAGIVVLLVSKDSMKSAWVTYEWAFAYGNGKKVVPVYIKDVQREDLHPALTTIHHINFIGLIKPWHLLLELLLEPETTGVKNMELRDQESEPTIEATFILDNRGIPNKLEGTSEYEINLKIVNAPAMTKRVEYELLHEGFDDNPWTKRRGKKLSQFKTDMSSWGDIFMTARGDDGWRVYTTLSQSLRLGHRANLSPHILKAIKDIEDN